MYRLRISGVGQLAIRSRTEFTPFACVPGKSKRNKFRSTQLANHPKVLDRHEHNGRQAAEQSRRQ